MLTRVDGADYRFLTHVGRKYPATWNKTDTDYRYTYEIKHVYWYGSCQLVSTVSSVNNQHIDPPPWVSSNVVNDYTGRCIYAFVYQTHYVQPMTWTTVARRSP